MKYRPRLFLLFCRPWRDNHFRDVTEKAVKLEIFKMNDKLKELIQPYWVEEQQGVYIPLIDKVLLKNNVPEMPYEDYMEYAKSNGVQIATKDELLQMYLQRDQINKILEKHNGDMLDTWFGSSSKHGLYSEWLVNFGSGYCYYTSNHYSYVSRAVADLKLKTKGGDTRR